MKNSVGRRLLPAIWTGIAQVVGDVGFARRVPIPQEVTKALGFQGIYEPSTNTLKTALLAARQPLLWALRLSRAAETCRRC